MMPTIVLDNGKPYMIVGTPGGSTIITSVLQSILNVMEFGLSPEEAVNKPKFHHQWQPDVIYVEEDFQIGRASCRERVWSTGGAGEEKEKVEVSERRME